MIDDRYEKLSMAEKENFSRIVNQLLAHTFIASTEYDPSEKISRVNKDYLFVERNFELMDNYFSLAGFRLGRDNTYGVIYLSSDYESNRVHFDKLQTLMIYVLRLIYEEKREEVSVNEEVIITVGELVHKMVTLGLISKRPSNVVLRENLGLFKRFRLIDKIDGKWDEADTRLIITPVALFAVTGEQISNMYALLEESDKQKAVEDDKEPAEQESAAEEEQLHGVYEEESSEQG